MTPATTASPPLRRRAGWLAMTVSATLIALIAAPYLTLDPDTFLAEQRAVYTAHRPALALHVGGAVVALLAGPWQFLPRLRARRPRLHRWTGRVYVLTATATGLGGLLLVPVGLYPPVAPAGFAALAVLTLVSTAAAVRAIRRGDPARHRIWMTRSYALIFTGVTFRLWLMALTAAGVGFQQAYVTGAWAGWALNLLVAERLTAPLRGAVGVRP
ncbi:DUF2306 domain-containing protein [Kitasatospora sp. NPDC057223]|uniref:DUF2306 domain-containing protein n=1 Tax=Kitasatospora sp. NPDC057223 TaxID=3346055 RepID=UPI00362C25A9